MKNLITLITLVLCVSSLGAKKPYEVSEIFPRLEIRGEVFVFDPSGKRIYYQTPETRSWRTRKENGKIDNQWSSEGEEHTFALHHVWEIGSDGTIKAKIKQYAKVEGPTGKPVFKDLVREEEFVIQDFSPVSWVLSADKDRKVVARFSPRLRRDETPKSLSEIPISGEEIIIYDSRGNLWAHHAEARGKYVGFITSRGGMQLSYYPFAGAKEVGKVNDRKMELTLDESTLITITSETAFLPPGITGKVYGIFHPDRKTERLNSLRAVTSNKEKEFLEHFAQK